MTTRIPFEVGLDLPDLEYAVDDSLVEGVFGDTLLGGRPRWLMNAVEAGAGCASRHEHALFYDPYGPDSMRPTLAIGRRHDEGLEAQRLRTRAAEYAGASNTMHTQERFHLIQPSRQDVADRDGAAIAGARAAGIDGLLTHHISTDTLGRTLDTATILRRQDLQRREIGADDVTYDGPIFLETHATEADDRRYGLRARPTHSTPETYPNLAAALLRNPTEITRGLFRSNPSIVKNLENIALDNGTTGDLRVFDSLIHLHLRDMEMQRYVDPMMIEYVEPFDPQFPYLGKVRARYDRIHSIAVGHVGEIGETDASIIAPLAVHMYERGIPTNVENVLAELEEICLVREMITHIHIKCGIPGLAPDEFYGLATPEEQLVLDDYSNVVIALMSPGQARVYRESIVYGEDDILRDAIRSTLFAPRSRYQRSKGNVHGGYHTSGQRTIEGRRFVDGGPTEDPSYLTYRDETVSTRSRASRVGPRLR